jgi:hypothetical protein
MARRGRPTSATSIVGRLRGTPQAKERLVVILSNLGGGLTVTQAVERLKFGRTLFKRLRRTMLAAALKTLEPRPRGRPVQEVPKSARKIRELEEKIRRLEEDLAFARVREELAFLIPWAGRRQKKIRRVRPSAPVSMPLGSPSDGSAGASPGPGPPGDSG